jgi:NADPH:quinone reductase-like Zn-dependent oxidoreductase
MLAAYIEGFGGPDVIRYGELPDPEPGPSQVLVRTEAVAVAVDTVDTYVRSGAWETPVTFPLALGRGLDQPPAFRAPARSRRG